MTPLINVDAVLVGNLTKRTCFKEAVSRSRFVALPLDKLRTRFSFYISTLNNIVQMVKYGVIGIWIDSARIPVGECIYPGYRGC